VFAAAFAPEPLDPVFASTTIFPESKPLFTIG
jgi:hypothetical protein